MRIDQLAFKMFALLLFFVSSSTSATTSFEHIQGLISEPNEYGLVQLPAGHFLIDRNLVSEFDNIKIKGEGVDKTILDFKGQVTGTEGIDLRGRNVSLSDLTILNTLGDGIRATAAEEVSIRNVKVGWETAPDNLKGTYGIYPISSKGVVIEDTETFGASEAGIYVGQSTDAKIIDNWSYQNTVGIEVENSVDTTISGNRTEKNSIGVMVTDIPGLPVYGRGVKIYNNEIADNNKANELENPSHLSHKQSGVGVLVVAGKDVTISNNRFREHNVSNIVALNYLSTGFNRSRMLYDPNVRGVVIGKNSHKPKPETEQKVTSLYGWKVQGAQFDVLWDGRITKHELYIELPKREYFCFRGLTTLSRMLPSDESSDETNLFKSEIYECD